MPKANLGTFANKVVFSSKFKTIYNTTYLPTLLKQTMGLEIVAYVFAEMQEKSIKPLMGLALVQNQAITETSFQTFVANSLELHKMLD